MVVRDEPPLKMSKLEIKAETEADRYDTILTLKCHACGKNDLDKSAGMVASVIDKVTTATTYAQKQDIVAWSDELKPCSHIEYLMGSDSRYAQEKQKPATAGGGNTSGGSGDTGATEESQGNSQENMDIVMSDERNTGLKIQLSKLGKCSQCELTHNLWLCLICGYIGCGRDQRFGVEEEHLKGNEHARAHAKGEQHALAVKIGSLSEGEVPDVFCYQCLPDKSGVPRGNEVIHSNLFDFLKHHGLDVSERQKTEKNLIEHSIERNLNFDFAMRGKDGKEATPLFGPGLTGLKNMGNTCYLASILQCLYDIPSFQTRFNLPAPKVSKPAEDLETQLRKVGTGLLSGRYSKPDPDLVVSEHSTGLPYQKGLTPAMLKHLIGRNHEEFKTAKQQDAYELMQHLLDKIATLPHPKELGDPTQSLRFVMEQRLQCRDCGKVRYSTNVHENVLVNVPVEEVPGEQAGDKSETTYEPVTLKECLDILTATEDVDLTCSSCGSHGFTKRQLFKTFPEVLVLVARKIVEKSPYEYVKVDVPVIVGDDPFDMDDSYFSNGLQPGEELLLDEPAPRAPQFVPNQAALAQLCDVGIPEGRAVKALFYTGNSDMQQAMDWVFDHADDPDIDGPLNPPAPSSKGKGEVVKEEDVTTLMGFCMWDELTIRKALFKHDGNIEHATNGLLGGNEYLDVTLPEVKDDEPEPVKEAVQANGTDGIDSTEIPGSSEHPAKFQLQSIVCHKGGSIHAGYVTMF